MSAAFSASWTGAGILLGAGTAVYSSRLLTSARSHLLAAGLTATLLTACAFGALAWRFDHQFDLLPYSVLAAVGVALGLIDLIERRLPRELVYSGLVLVAVLLATSAILHSRGLDLLRALASMAILVAFYLVLALASRGGLGAGDVKLGGLLGLALGWLSWSSLVTATLVAWFGAGLVWFALQAMGLRSRYAPLPMGPFLVLGALFTIVALPA